MNKGYKYLTMLGHLCTDINQGALPAIIPFLVLSHNLSYAAAASVFFAANLVSSVIQPYFGFLGDKYSMPWLMSLGMVLAGSGIALIGIAPSYLAILGASAISGIGIALFHPEGGKIANFVAGDRKGTGLGVFLIGGNFGFVFGPILATTAIVFWGLRGTLVFLIPVFVMGTILLFFTSKFKEICVTESKTRNERIESGQVDDWNGFSKVAIVISFRSIIQYSLLAFIPLYFINVFSQSEATANTNLTIFLFAAAVSTIIGARISDDIGFRRLIRITFFAMAPLLFLMLQTNNSVIALVLVALAGASMNSSAGTLVAMGQATMPNRIGLATGITLGLAVSVGGVFAPLIGLVGDNFGLITAMYTIVGITFVAWLLTLILPEERKA